MIFARLADLDWHQHHAAGICIALEPDAQLQFLSEANGEWRDFHAIRIPPRCGHAFRFGGQAAAFLFFDPGSIFYQKVFGELSQVEAWPEEQAADALQAIRRLWHDTKGDPHVNHSHANQPAANHADAIHPNASKSDAPSTLAGLAQEKRIADTLEQIPCSIQGDDIATLYGDPRIQRVVQTILEWPEPDGAPDIESLAAVAGLSASRLAHLFQERVGLPVRALRTWFRLKTAAIHIRRGASLTEAGVAAGFYDQAHFTRTFRQMFGLPPSQIFPRARSTVRWHIEAEELTLALGAGRQDL